MSRLLSYVGSVTTAVGSNTLLNHDVTIDYIGVPLNVLVACIFGTFAGFAFRDDAENAKLSRYKQIWLFIGCVIMGGSFTGATDWLVSALTDMEIKRGALASMGAIISCFMPFLIPRIIERLGPWLDKIPFLKPTPKQDEAP